MKTDSKAVGVNPRVESVMEITADILADKRNRHRAWLFLIFATLCWGANAVFGKLAVGEVSPMRLVSLRWLGALLLLSLVARRDIHRDWPVLRANLARLSIMGTLGFALFTILLYLSAHFTSAVNIGIVQGSIPVFVLMGAYLVYHNSVGAFQVCGVALTLLGVAILISAASVTTLLGLKINLGDGLMLLACSSYAAYILGLQHRLKASIMSQFTLMTAAAFIVSLPFAGFEAWLGYGLWPTKMGWLIVVLITVFPSFLAQLSFIHGVALIGPARAGVFVNLVPVFAAVMAVMFLGETFKEYHGLALILVLGGIWLSEQGKQDG